MCHRKLTEQECTLRDEVWAKIMGRPPKPRVQTAPPEEKESETRNLGRVGSVGRNHTKHKLWILVAVVCLALAVAGISSTTTANSTTGIMALLPQRIRRFSINLIVTGQNRSPATTF